MSGSPRQTALRLIDQLLILAGPGAELVDASEREWSSATFSGARHIIRLSLPVASADAPQPSWVDAVGEHGFELARAFVADASAIAAAPKPAADGGWRCLCAVELLTVDDDVA